MDSFPFMKLPREIRDKVYSCCLMVEGHITPYPEYYRYRRNLDYKGDKLRSFIGILSVSELVHDEAAPIFYGKNTFRISAMMKDLTYDFMWYDANEPKEVTMTSTPEKQIADLILSQSSQEFVAAVPKTRFGLAKAILSNVRSFTITTTTTTTQSTGWTILRTLIFRNSMKKTMQIFCMNLHSTRLKRAGMRRRNTCGASRI